jgi:hypothetical protein
LVGARAQGKAMSLLLRCRLVLSGARIVGLNVCRWALYPVIVVLHAATGRENARAEIEIQSFRWWR